MTHKSLSKNIRVLLQSALFLMWVLLGARFAFADPQISIEWEKDTANSLGTGSPQNISFAFSLKNSGNQDAQNVVVIISATDNKVIERFPISQINFGTIPVGGSRDNEANPFVGTLAALLKQETLVHLVLTINANGYRQRLTIDPWLGTKKLARGLDELVTVDHYSVSNHKIAYSAARCILCPSIVYTLDIPSGRRTQITEESVNGHDPRISGSYLVYSTLDPPSWRIHLYNLETRTDRPLMRGVFYDFDGNNLVYSADASCQRNVFVYNIIAGTQVGPIQPAGGGCTSDGKISGDTVTFGHAPERGQPMHIYIYDVPTNQLQDTGLDTGSQIDGQPLISGRKILFSKPVQVLRVDLFVYDWATTELKKVVEDEYLEGATISDLSGQVIWASCGGPICSRENLQAKLYGLDLNAENTESIQITFSGFWQGWPMASLDTNEIIWRHIDRRARDGEIQVGDFGYSNFLP